jgi:hypothetical protein
MKEFAQAIRLHKFKANQRIFNHFDQADSMYMII